MKFQKFDMDKVPFKTKFIVTVSVLVFCVSLIIIINTVNFLKSRKEINETRQIERLYDLSQIWALSYEHYGAWQTVPELDWNKAFMDYTDKAKDVSYSLNLDNVWFFMDNLDATESMDVNYQYGKTSREFIGLLNDGHTGLQYLYSPQRLPINLEFIEGRLFATNAQTEMRSLVPVNSEITAINGMTPMEYFDVNYLNMYGSKTPGAKYAYLLSPYFIDRTKEKIPRSLGSKFAYIPSSYFNDREKESIDVTFVTPDGETKTSPLAFCIPLADSLITDSLRLAVERRIGGLPFANHHTYYSGYETLKVYELENEIFYFDIYSFSATLLDVEIEDFFSKNNIAEKAKGFIIDIRRNPGGKEIYNAYTLLSIFTNLDGLTYEYHTPYTDSSLMAAASRVIDAHSTFSEVDSGEIFLDGLMMLGNQYEKVDRGNMSGYVEPRTNLLTQNAILLTGYETGGTAEIFAELAKQSGRFTVLGTNTLGAAGDLFTRSNLAITPLLYMSASRFFGSEGYDIQNNGIQPHVWSEQTAADLADNRDTTLLKAFDMLNMANTDPDAYEKYLQDNKYEPNIESAELPENMPEIIFDRLKTCGIPDGVLSDGEKILGLAEIWRRVTQFYSGLNQPHWNIVYESHILPAIKAKNVRDYYKVLSEFISDLGDANSFVLSPDDKETPAPENDSYAVFPLPEGGKFYISTAQ